MPVLTWTEYLRELGGHLEKIRQVVQTGGQLPKVPEPPGGKIPEECVAEASRLGEEYDKLAREVSARMAEIDRQVVSHHGNPHRSRRRASYIETEG